MLMAKPFSVGQKLKRHRFSAPFSTVTLCCKFLEELWQKGPLIKKWAPITELATFVSVGYVGACFGTALTYPLGGWLVSHYDWEVSG